MSTDQGLWPAPQEIIQLPGHFSLPPHLIWSVPDHLCLETAFEKLTALWLQYASGEISRQQTDADSAHASLNIDSRCNPQPNSYELCIRPHEIRLLASTKSGLFYAVMTLCQWVRLHGLGNEGRITHLACVEIRDWPDFPQRGFMIDISRSKVPTMNTLFSMVDMAAEFKINQLQLYTEHTFAYEGHETVHAQASPMTPEEIRELDAYCRARCVDLVPNQNSFGHFHQWLKHDKYRQLAECPDGIKHPFSLDLEPFSLCPTDPGSLALLEDLYEQLLPNFGSDLFNVGLDETFDLGQGRSAQACDQRGKTHVYLDFLGEVYKLIQGHGKRMQFWGDIIIAHPDLLDRLPQDVIALEWGYEADHPFDEHAAKFAASGRPFYVCPGTSSWSSVVGRVDNAFANLIAAAKAGQQHGAVGYLMTDWGDYGHFQPPAISWPSWVGGAGAAWHVQSLQTDHPEAIKTAITRHLLHSQTTQLVDALWNMGLAYRDCGMQPSNGSSLFFILLYADQPMTHERLNGLTQAGLKASRDRLIKARLAIQKAPLDHPTGQLLKAELLWACDLVLFACDLGSTRLQRGGELPLNQLPDLTRKRFTQELDQLAVSFIDLRNQRFRPGGTQAALRYLRRIQHMLIAKQPD